MKVDRFRTLMPSGAAVVLLMVFWFCRQPFPPPVAVGDSFFHVRSDAPDVGLSQLVVHSVGAGEELQGAMRMDSIDSSMELGGLTDSWRRDGGRNLGTSVSAPRFVMPRIGTEAGRVGHGLLDADSLDPYDGMASEPTSASWGWLARDVDMANQGARDTLSERQPATRDRRFLSDGGDTLGRGRSSRNDDSFYHRLDRRF